MKKPELLKTDRYGGTIHLYQLTGGQSTYDRYLVCNKGVCSFHNELKQAEDHLEKIK